MAVAAATSFSIVKPSSPFLPPTKALRPLYKLHLPAARNYEKPPPFSVSNALLDTSMPVFAKRAPPDSFVSRFSPDELRKGADALVEALERAGVTDVYAYPGGASMEIHQALTRSDVIRNIICRHEQGEIFAAEGYARISGRAGVCIATAGPGATNLVSGLADAMLDSVHLVAITGQVPRRMIGTNAFQEIPIVEITRFITKHEYLVLDVEGIPRVVKEAFFLATSSRPGPVIIDVPKDIKQMMVVPTWDPPMKLHGYQSRLPKKPDRTLLDQLLRLVFNPKKPVLYVGGDCLNSRVELRRFVEVTGIETTRKLNFWARREELMEQKEKFPLSYKTFGQAISPQYAIKVLEEFSNGEAIITTGVGQHQMWAAQWYRYNRPRQWATSGGLGAMGFGLPAAIGAAVASPGTTVVDIDGDGSFIMNDQELAHSSCGEPPCQDYGSQQPAWAWLFNHRHLGTVVVRWKDIFFNYLVLPSPYVITSLKAPSFGIIGSTCSRCGTITSKNYGPGISNIV